MTYQMHVLVKFFLLVSIAILLAYASLFLQLVLFVVLVTAAICSNVKTFFRMLRRIRWLLLILLIIYAYSTPGEYLKYLPITLSPSYEGIRSGLLQAAKIITVIAVLSMLLSTTTKDVLIGGIYQLLRPFAIFNIDAKKIAVRTWLTMYYVESQEIRKHQSNSIHQLMEDVGLHDSEKSEKLIEEITITVAPLTRLDLFVVLTTLVSLYWYYFLK